MSLPKYVGIFVSEIYQVSKTDFKLVLVKSLATPREFHKYPADQKSEQSKLVRIHTI